MLLDDSKKRAKITEINYKNLPPPPFNKSALMISWSACRVLGIHQILSIVAFKLTRTFRDCEIN